MDRLKWLSVGVLAFALFACLWTWPTSAQAPGSSEPKLVDRLGTIEKRLEHMEKTLFKIQEQLKELQPKAGWQKISDKDSNGVMVFMDTSSGKVRWVNTINPGLLQEK